MRPKTLIFIIGAIGAIGAFGLCPEVSIGQTDDVTTCPLGYHRTYAKDCESDDHLQRIRPAYGQHCPPGEQLEEMLTCRCEGTLKSSWNNCGPCSLVARAPWCVRR